MKGGNMRKNNQRGSLSVEAAIFTTFFIIFFVSLMNLADLVRAQVLLQNAVTQTAKEISQYSYVLTKVGIVKKSNETSTKAKGFTSDVDSVVDDLTEISSAINGAASGGDISSSMSTIIESAQSASGTLDTYMENPENILAGVVAVGKSSVADAAKAAIVGGITKARLKTHIAATGADPNDKLVNLGVVNGLNGLDFSDSEWFSGGNQDIKIVVKYKMKIKYMFGEVELPEFKVCASTRIW